MGKKEKLIERLKSIPKDFTFSELQALMNALGFEQCEKGRTSGSRVKFVKGEVFIILHKPHPRKELLEYQVKQVYDNLKKAGLI